MNCVFHQGNDKPWHNDVFWIQMHMKESKFSLLLEIQLTKWNGNNAEVSYIPPHTVWQHAVNWNMFEWRRKKRKGRISKGTANRGVALYLLGRWGVITANFNQFRSIIHGQGPSKLISKMPLLSLALWQPYMNYSDCIYTKNSISDTWSVS